jgi:hypothetical protein
MKTVPLFVVFVMLNVLCFSQMKDQNINKYGAVADGITNNAAAIQQAIDKVSASGGGRVIIPPGNYMTGAIFLKSGVDLHLQLGATLLGPTTTEGYLKAKSRPSIVSARDQHDIAISGQGIIDGQAQELMLDIFKKLRSGELKEDSIWLVKRPGVARANNINIVGCKNVKVTGITLKNSSDWVQDYRQCDNVVIDRIKVQSTAYWNNDGLDITDSKNVRITNCYINSSDDAICLKSEDARFLCENIYIDSCTVRSSANGFKLGTASFGGFKNIVVRNLTVYDTYRSAIALESVDGGILENIDIRGVTARNTGNAIFIRRGHRNVNGKVGSLKGVHIADVKADIPLFKPDQGYPIEGPPDHLNPGFDKMPRRPSSYHIYGHPFLPYNLIPSSIVGIPGYPVENVLLENIHITYGGKADKNIAFIAPDAITKIPENKDRYPEFSMWGELPSWGFYMRHASGIQVKNMTLSYIQDDFRPAIVMDDVQTSNISDLIIPTAKEMPMIRLNNTKDVVLKNLKIPVTEEKAVIKTSHQ